MRLGTKWGTTATVQRNSASTSRPARTGASANLATGSDSRLAQLLAATTQDVVGWLATSGRTNTSSLQAHPRQVDRGGRRTSPRLAPERQSQPRADDSRRVPKRHPYGLHTSVLLSVVEA